MPSPNTYSRSRGLPPHRVRCGGFTLIEIIVTLAIFTAIFGLGLFMTMDTYRGFNFRSEPSTAVSVLQKARSRAINNYYQTPHGVCYDGTSHSYIIFRGANYTAGAGTNEAVEGGSGATVSGFPPCTPVGSPWIVFEQLTGKLTPRLTPATAQLGITISQDTRTTTIHINNEGRINW